MEQFFGMSSREEIEPERATLPTASPLHDIGMCIGGACIPPVLATRLGRQVAPIAGIAEAASRDARLRDVLRWLNASAPFLAARRLLQSATIPFLRHIAWHSSTVLDRHAEDEQAKLFRRQSSRIFLSKRPMTAAFTLSWIRALSFTVGALLLVSLRLWDSPSVREEFVHTTHGVRLTVLALRDRGATQLSSTGLAAFGVSMTQTIKHGRVLSTPSIYAGPCHIDSSQPTAATQKSTLAASESDPDVPQAGGEHASRGADEIRVPLAGRGKLPKPISPPKPLPPQPKPDPFWASGPDAETCKNLSVVFPRNLTHAGVLYAGPTPSNRSGVKKYPIAGYLQRGTVTRI